MNEYVLTVDIFVEADEHEEAKMIGDKIIAALLAFDEVLEVSGATVVES